MIDAEITDPGLFRKHSSFKCFTTSVATYPAIRVFYHPHPQAAKLPTKPTPLPLLVFIHGLGGSLSQFQYLLTSLVNIAPCLGIDLPGCGLSEFSPKSWESYSLEALAELVLVIIERYCDKNTGQGVVLVSHSLGCSLSALLVSKASCFHAQIKFDILGLIAICPRASPPSTQQIASFRTLLKVPNPLFDLWRRWDRRGGPHSASVARFVGSNADLATKKLQERFNAQSQTAVWRRMAWGALPTIGEDGTMTGGLPGPDLWAGISTPLFLIAGEMDTITRPEEISIICKALGKPSKPVGNPESDVLPEAAGPTMNGRSRRRSRSAHGDEDFGLGESMTETILVESKDRRESEKINASTAASQPLQVLKTSVVPSPASHALLYDHATYRTLAGLIQTFLADNVDGRLSLGWQLQYLSTEGKWDVKNLVKWQAVKPVSESIGGIFRAMKTLREIDDTHSPSIFVSHWRDKIKAVIDISHESPVYDPKGLENGGIEYHKFPTVSKIPPTVEEVKDFICLVDRLRGIKHGESTSPTCGDEDRRLIGVHCHYGFNRTGFFICSYLIEKEGFTVQQAFDEFQARRPPGIRHEHFIDTLFVRYCVGLKRAPSL